MKKDVRKAATGIVSIAQIHSGTFQLLSVVFHLRR